VLEVKGRASYALSDGYARNAEYSNLRTIKMKYIDLFGGIGGFRLGIEKATNKEWGCVWYNDIDKYPGSVYNRRFNEEYEAKDIREVYAREIPRHDCICAGFPCQNFSTAGKRKGLEDTRGTLFFEICRIAQHHQPKLLFLENVKGLLSHDEGKTFKIILKSLWELGYGVEWQVLNSKNFGVPQNRERVFIIGHLGGFGGRQVFPITEISGLSNEEESTVYCLDASYYKGSGKQSRSVILCDSGQGRKTQLRSENIPPLRANTGAGYNNIVCHSTAIERRVPEVTGCLTGGGHSGGHHPAMTLLKTGLGIRRLTPVECERLQGFPDGWTEGISDTRRYKCLGNAVTVNVIEAIVKRMIEVGIA